MAPPIPDRWLKYKPIGKRIEGTRFIAFKVPLKENVSQSINEDERLDGNLLLMEIPNLGLIIDLTNTNRYYDPLFFQREGVAHKKIMIPGHATPPKKLVKQFKLHVLNFLDDNRENDKLIGVHCTHGVNRTGYLICNYMISEMSITPKEAIRRFNVARGHKIERTNYLEALYELKKISSSPTADIKEKYEKSPKTARRSSSDDSISSSSYKMSNPTRDYDGSWRERHEFPEPARYSQPERSTLRSDAPSDHHISEYDRPHFRTTSNRRFDDDIRSSRMERDHKSFHSMNNQRGEQSSAVRNVQRYYEPTRRTTEYVKNTYNQPQRFVHNFNRFSNKNHTDEFGRTNNKSFSNNFNRFSYNRFSNNRDTSTNHYRNDGNRPQTKRFNLPTPYVDKRKGTRQNNDYFNYQRNNTSYEMSDRDAIRREYRPNKDGNFYQRNTGYSSQMPRRPTTQSTNYGNSLPSRRQYADVRERRESYNRDRNHK